MASIVTGAFGYIGRYITRHLLQQGEQVATITTHPDKPNPFGNNVQAFPYNFNRSDELTAALRGAETLYNTYWIRFEYDNMTYRQAVENTITLFECARKAGVKKIVHISVTNAASAPELPYYVGKEQQEKALMNCGVSYSIIRPTLVFGREDILVNNIAWLIRKFPIFPIFATGKYKVQPVFVEDLAAIAVSTAKSADSIRLDAIGPEVYTFQEFVQLIAAKIKPAEKFIHVPPLVGIALGHLIGFGLQDVVLTRAELQGLMKSLLTSNQIPNGETRFSEWLVSNNGELGSTYSSEISRHFRWREKH
ncbi:MAG: NAD-dependent epimerase/dehydratase family protein [Chloroflexota bacterium]